MKKTSMPYGIIGDYTIELECRNGIGYFEKIDKQLGCIIASQDKRDAKYYKYKRNALAKLDELKRIYPVITDKIHLCRMVFYLGDRVMHLERVTNN